MKKRIISTAYHEAGHVIALLLIKRRFKYVSIVPEKSKNAYESGTLGHVKSFPLRNKYQWEINTFLDPAIFDKYFKDDFVKVAGLVAEKIHTGRFNNLGAGGDFRKLFYTTLMDMPDKLSLGYQKFLIEYTREVLEMKVNWIRITAIAEGLLERGTLSYDQVWDVIW